MMKRIPAFYLLPSRLDECSHALRMLMIDELIPPEQALEDIAAARRQAESPADRRKLAALALQIFDLFGSPGIAELVEMLNLRPERGHSLSETAAHVVFGYSGEKNLTFREKEIGFGRMTLPHELPQDILLCNPASRMNIIYITPQIMVHREADGTLCVTCTNNNGQDILIDEERFNGERPLYFTESTHFVSPVYMVNSFTAVLLYALRLLGYPMMRVHRKVYFSHPGAYFINFDDYTGENSDNSDWEGVEVVTRKQLGSQFYIDAAYPIAYTVPDSPWKEMNHSLMIALRTAQLAFCVLDQGSSMMDLSHKNIQRAIERCNIFKEFN